MFRLMGVEVFERSCHKILAEQSILGDLPVVHVWAFTILLGQLFQSLFLLLLWTQVFISGGGENLFHHFTSVHRLRAFDCLYGPNCVLGPETPLFILADAWLHLLH
jgi:hypothetical protein